MSDLAIKPKNFIDPSPAIDQLKVEVEWSIQPEIEGLFIDLVDENGDAQEVHFIQTDKQTVEEWILENGEEGEHYEYDKIWYDDYPNGGYYESIRCLIQDNYQDGLILYATCNRSLWKQHS